MWSHMASNGQLSMRASLLQCQSLAQYSCACRVAQETRLPNSFKLNLWAFGDLKVPVLGLFLHSCLPGELSREIVWNQRSSPNCLFVLGPWFYEWGMDPWSLHLNKPFRKAVSSFFFPDRFPLKNMDPLKKRKSVSQRVWSLVHGAPYPTGHFFFFFFF